MKVLAVVLVGLISGCSEFHVVNHSDVHHNYGHKHSNSKSNVYLDSDGDGVLDFGDLCPKTPRGSSVSAEGCPTGYQINGEFVTAEKCADAIL